MSMMLLMLLMLLRSTRVDEARQQGHRRHNYNNNDIWHISGQPTAVLVVLLGRFTILRPHQRPLYRPIIFPTIKQYTSVLLIIILLLTFVSKPRINQSATTSYCRNNNVIIVILVIPPPRLISIPFLRYVHGLYPNSSIPYNNSSPIFPSRR